MRLKVLVFPVAIIVSTVVSIAYIYPEIQSVIANKKELEMKSQLLASLSQKLKNVESLKSSYESDVDSRNKVMSFIPINAEEETAVNNFHRILSLGGAVLLDARSQTILDKKSTITEEDGVLSDEELAKKLFRKGNMESQMKIAGEYKGIKDILGGLAVFSRQNRVVRAVIQTTKNPVNNQEENPNILTMDITSRFVYAPQVQLAPGQSPQAFDKSSFDFSFLNDYRLKGADVTVEQTDGRENPFLP